MGDVDHLPVERRYIFDKFVLDVASRQLRRHDEPVFLNARAFDTLLVLLQHRDRVVEKDELLKAVWPNSFVSDDSLTQSIWTLRRTLGDDSAHPHFVATIPRRGYRFVAPVTVTGGPSTEVVAAAEQVATTSDHEQRPAAIAATSQPTPSQKSVSYRPRMLVRWLAIGRLLAAGAVVALLVLGLLRWSTPAPRQSAGPVRFPLVAPAGTALVSGAVVSPDGRHLAFVAQNQETGAIRLWLSALDTGEARSLTGTDGATRPFWSPDSQSLGFFANGRLKTVGINANQPRTIATAGLNPAGGSWSASGVILFAGSRSGIYSVPDTGGRASAVTMLDAGTHDRAHRWPAFLPDGRRFLYTVVSSNPERAGTYVGSLDSAEQTRLFESPITFAAYVPADYVVYIRDRTLMVQHFDTKTARPVGTPTIIAADVAVPDFLNGATMSGSSTGVLTFGEGGTGGRLVWFSRSGERLAAVDAPTLLHNPNLSIDQRYVLADTSGEINPDLAGVWAIDLERGSRTRLGPGGTPLWSPEADRVAFASSEKGVGTVNIRSFAGHNESTALLTTSETIGLNDWSRDGRYIVYISNNASTKKDLWLLPTFGTKQPVPFLQTPFEELQGRVSPDGRWLAYTSDESGTWEVYVQSFPTAGQRYVVSTGGGGEPQWREDGRELYYMAVDNTLMSVAVAPGTLWQNSRPQPLFKAPLAGDFTRYRARYQVANDGMRFLLDAMDDDPDQRATIIVNWPELIGR